jgi:hypothetical protein
MPAEYSKSPLVKKLALKPKSRVAVLNAPEGYRDLLGELPPETTYAEMMDGNGHYDWIQVFVTQKQALYDQLPSLKQHLAPNGTLWITFPRDKQKTDLNRNAVIPAAIQDQFGLTPVANAVVNDDWTAYRLKHYVS